MKIFWIILGLSLTYFNLFPLDEQYTAPTIVDEPQPEAAGDSSIYTMKINYLNGVGDEIELTRNPEAVDPTYDQVIQFIKADRTDRNEYIPNEYICGDFAQDVQRNAELAGYNCAWVYIEYEEGPAHACNMFNTSDQGPIFVDCTRSIGEGPTNQDKIVHVVEGDEYLQRLVKSSVEYEPQSTDVDIVESYKIIWDGDLFNL